MNKSNTSEVITVDKHVRKQVTFLPTDDQSNYVQGDLHSIVAKKIDKMRKNLDFCSKSVWTLHQKLQYQFIVGLAGQLKVRFRI